MYNLQADGLNHAILKSNNQKLYHLSFEPLAVKKSEIKHISVDELIELGDKLPHLYIYRKGIVVGQARLGQIDGKETIVVSAKERIVDMGKPDSKYAILDCRIAIIPKDEFVVGRLARIPMGSISSIILFIKDRPIATARLVEGKNRYFLQVKEVF